MIVRDVNVQSLPNAPAWEAGRVGTLATLLGEFALPFQARGAENPGTSPCKVSSLSDTGFGTMPFNVNEG